MFFCYSVTQTFFYIVAKLMLQFEIPYLLLQWTQDNPELKIL